MSLVLFYLICTKTCCSNFGARCGCWIFIDGGFLPLVREIDEKRQKFFGQEESVEEIAELEDQSRLHER